MQGTRARGPDDTVRGGSRLAARAGYDRWAEPPLINNALVALLHNPRPLVPFVGSSRARRVVNVGPAHDIGSSVTVDYYQQSMLM